MDRILVLGGGVAAAGVREALTSKNKSSKFTVDCVSSDALAPTCSLRSTAIAALRGTRRGLSPLGDELVDCWESAQKFYRRGHQGVVPLPHVTWLGNDEKDFRRFQHLHPQNGKVEEDAFLIVPELFLASYPTRRAFLQGLTPEGGGWRASFLGGTSEWYAQVVLAGGQWASWLPAELGHPRVRAVQGTYAEWSVPGWVGPSFSHNIRGTQVIYQGPEQRLLLGATSVKDQTGDAFNVNELKLRYAAVVGELALAWPRWEEARFKTGIRSQGPERRPFAREIAPKLYAVGGFYKNGWIYAWKFGETIAELLVGP